MKTVTTRGKVVIVVGLVAACASGVELGFRAFLRATGRDVITVLPPQEVLAKAWFKPHPQLLFTFKPNTGFTMTKFDRPRITVNGFGFRSTLEYDVTTVTRPDNAIRIATLGGSTTMGVNDDDRVWPYLLGRNLAAALPARKIEVLNEGLMGYTSLENLLDLTMRVIDYDCDAYVIYLGVNDLLPSAPVDLYRSDYSHYRKTIYETFYESPVSCLPRWLLHLKTIRGLLQIAGVPDSRDLLKNTGAGQFRRNFSVGPQDEAKVAAMIRRTVLRNVTSMIGVIREHRPDAVIALSSFYDLENRTVISGLNSAFAQLAIRHNVLFVDVARRLPRDQSMAYDYGHFTPKGDSMMGQLVFEVILPEIQAQQQRGRAVEERRDPAR